MAKKLLLTVSMFLILASGAFANSRIANLSSGKTTYELSGDDNAPLVVMIHGVSGPMTIWDRTIPNLIEHGYQVLRYDLYGRGGSERVSGPYNRTLYLKQLEELLDHLNLSDKPINFMASSMGNIISSEYILKYPDMISSFTMIGPAGFNIGENWTAKLISYSILGEFMTGLFGHRMMMERNREYFFEPEKFQNFINSYEKQLKISGSKRAILSTMRNMPVKDYIEGYEEIGKLNIPTVLIWGEEDQSFSFTFSNDLLRVIPHAEFIPVSHAAHLPHYERNDFVTPFILDFLERKAI